MTAAHRAKVYSLAPAGAPSMAGTHLDTRVINGKSWLLFGPFAGWSPKFLKQGKITDLPRSVRPNNLVPTVTVGLTQIPLVRYLIGQLLQSRIATGCRCCANSCPVQSIPIGNSTSRGSGCR